MIIDIKIDPAGLKLLQDKLGKYGSRSALVGASKEAGLLIVRKVALKTPVNTGAAKGAAHLKSADYRGAIVAGTLKYLPPLEEGSRAHIIVPRKAKVLAFHTPSGKVFTKKVKHPGTKGVHMYRDGLLEAKDAVIVILQKHLLQGS